MSEKSSSPSDSPAAAAREPATALEKLMYRPVPLWALLAILLFGALATILFGAIVLSAATGGSFLKRLQGPALTIARAPGVVRSLLTNGDPWAARADNRNVTVGFWDNPRDKLVDDGFLLIPVLDPEGPGGHVILMRLADGRILRDFRPDIPALKRISQRYWPQIDESRPFQVGVPDLADDGGIVFSGRQLLVRADPCAHIQWVVSGAHHSIERGLDNDYWVPAVIPRARRPDVAQDYREEGIMRVTGGGKIAFVQSLSAIFERNGLEALIRGRPYTSFPFHLNDVEPMLTDGPYWRRGDLFLSLRHMSMVMLYRPSTGKLLWWRIGPWLSQHDVHILDDHRISIFDNRVSQGHPGDTLLGNNRLVVMDFSNNQISTPFDQAFVRNQMKTVTGGRAMPLANGDFVVEDTTAGVVERMNSKGVLRWRFVHGDQRGHRFSLSWARYLEPAKYGQAIAAAVGARCQ